jgi:chitin synthase
VRSIQDIAAVNGPITFGDFFSNAIFRNVVISIAATLGLYVVASLLFVSALAARGRWTAD